jgi:hypothetical protein
MMQLEKNRTLTKQFLLKTALFYILIIFHLPAFAQTTSLKGNVHSPTMIPLEGVKMNLKGANNLELNTITDALGNYQFDNLPVDTEVLITLEKEDNIQNGVTMLDAFWLRNLVLGVSTQILPSQVLAMDLNKSGGLTTFDIILIQRAVLGKMKTFPVDTPIWRFIEATKLEEYVPSNLEVSTEISNTITITGNAPITVDFLGVKMGDANNSVLIK